jgi:hypothetical protein
VDTVQVTVTNSDPGAENLHQITYQVTGTDKTRCTAADFSVDGRSAGTADTVVYDDDLAAGAHVTHSFTLQMIDTGVNQDACAGAHVHLTAIAS